MMIFRDNLDLISMTLEKGCGGLAGVRIEGYEEPCDLEAFETRRSTGIRDHGRHQCKRCICQSQLALPLSYKTSP